MSHELDDIFKKLENYHLGGDFYPSSLKADLANTKKSVEEIIATTSREARRNEWEMFALSDVPDDVKDLLEPYYMARVQQLTQDKPAA